MPKKEGCLFRLCDFETFNKGGKMKKLKTLMSLTIGLAIGLGFVGKANGADCWVATAANGGDDSHGGADSADAVLTIGKALTIATTSGDSIHVTAGTYAISSHLNITVAGLILKSTAGYATTIISSSTTNDIICLNVGADNVTIDGFTFDGNSSNGMGIYSEADGYTIKNNKFVEITAGANLNMCSSFEVVTSGTIDNNIFIGKDPHAQGIILGAPNAMSNVTISNNTLSSFVTADMTIIMLAATSGNMSNITVTGNTVTDCGDNGYGLTIWDGGDNIDVTNNTFSGCKYGVRVLTTAPTNVTITGNDITNNAHAGILIDKWTTSNFIHQNNISGNVTYGVENLSGEVADADSNWWGSTTGPYHSTNTHGTGNAVSGDVTYVPWLDAPGGNATGGVPATVLLSASETSVVVGGNTSLITSTLTDAIGNPIRNETIDYTVTAGDGTLSNASGTTDDWGKDTTTFSSPTLAGTNTVKGAYSGAIYATVDIEVTHGPLARVETTPVDTTVVVTDDVTIVAELMDTYRNHIDATSVDEVIFTKSDSAKGTFGTKSITGGKIQIPYTTHTIMETDVDTITATTATGSYTDYSVVSTIGGEPATMKLWAAGDSSVVVSDTTNTLALYDSLFDQYDNQSVYSDYYANEKYDVIFTWSAGAGIVDPDTVAVGDHGYCTTNYKSSTVIGTYTVTATSGAATATATVPITQTADVLAAVSLTPDSAWKFAGEDVTLTAELLDQFGNHINGDAGDVGFNIVSGLGSLGSETVEADSTISIPYTTYTLDVDTAEIEVVATTFKDTSIVINTAPAALDHFALDISNATPTAGDEVTITITAEDAGNFRIYTYDNDDIIALTLDGSAAEASQVRWIIPTTPPDTVLALTASIPESLFTNGLVAFEVLNKKAEAVTVTAVDTAGHTGTCDTITWAPVATLDHYGVVVQTDPIYGNFEFTITVNPCDKYGNVTTAELPRVIKFQANETGVTLSGDPLPCDRILEGPTDYTDMIADHATDSLVITVADYATPAIIGCSDTITVGGERDVGPTIVLFPPDTVYIDSTYNVIVRCENFGDEGESPKVECIITGEGYTYADTQYAILPFGGTDDVTFADWTVPLDAKGTFTITVVTLLSSDVNPGNDTLIAQIVSRAYGVEEDRVPMPTRFEFLSIFPNPVSCHAKITYAIPVKSRIDMKIYDITGKLVTTLKNGVIEEPGYKVANWNMTDARGKKVNSGIYFCNLEMNKESSTKKILVIK